jgi:transglutaminase-like putative cysteine protease
VLGDYDGLVWTVGSGGAAAAAEFRPVDTRLPPAPADTRDRPTVSAAVDVVDLDGPWLPSPGWPTAVTVDAPDPLRANLRTGTLALAGGVPPGLSYEITALLPPEPSDEELLTRSITSAVMSEEALAGLPPQVRNLAADLLEGQDFGWRQVMTVRDAFQGAGAFYDSSANVRPGHSYFRLAEFLADELRIVGYEEQYAAAAAVILRSAQIPARAVVGYELPAERWTDGTATAVAEDITAWVEVHVEGLGWVAVDVTPDRSRTPTEEEQGTVFEDVAVPNPPPPPPIPPNVEVLTDEDEEEEEVTDDSVPDSTPGAEGAGWGAGRAVAAGAGALILLFVVLGGTVVLAKLTRRRTRRSAPETADRVAGAWLELADRCMEAQVPLQQQATPKEAARAYLATEPSATAVGGDLLALVDEVDRAAYHRDPPRDEQADQAWKYCDRVVDALVSERSVGRRIVMRLDPRPLRHRDPIGGRRR